jgi:uncharacterized MnhB-related membrane protein
MLASCAFLTLVPAAVLLRMMLRSLPSVSKNRRLHAAAASSAPGLVMSLVTPLPPMTKLKPAAAIS